MNDHREPLKWRGVGGGGMGMGWEPWREENFKKNTHLQGLQEPKRAQAPTSRDQAETRIMEQLLVVEPAGEQRRERQSKRDELSN